ncbi:MAG: hypothetical protein MJZ50_01910 [Treponema sp.]|nr:hypothetical protein [Treponema sp.]
MKKIIFKLALAFSVFSAFAAYHSNSVPDSTEIRKSIINSWLKEDVSVLREKKEEFVLDPTGLKFQVRMEESNDEFCIIIAPRSEIDINMINGDSSRIMRAEVFPKGGIGSWILYRDKKKGFAKRAEIHFNQDSDVYIQLRNEGQKTYADLYVKGSYAAKSVLTGMPFEKVYTASLQEIQDMTRKSIPWNRVTVRPDQYNGNQVLITTVRQNLPTMEFMEDACYDERGKLRSILTGEPFIFRNESGDPVEMDTRKTHYLCGAGFVKWIIDGIVEPVCGRGAVIRDLTEPTVEDKSVGKNGVMSQQWNLGFTLDWCRNLASVAYDVRSSRSANYANAGLDVNWNWFAQDFENGRFVNSTGYIKNTGYKVDNVRALLYLLGCTEPDWFYLAAIRQGTNIDEDELVFNNCAVIVPYFDRNGRFACVVFEQGRELSIDEFVQKYKGSFVHLERVKSTEAFFPYEKK